MNTTVSRILCLLVLNTLGSGDTQVDRMRALKFADKDSYISFIPSAAIYQITQKASVCAWLKKPATKHSKVFAYESSNFLLSGSGYYNYAAYFGGFPQTTPSSVIAVLTEWHHVCLTFSAGSNMAKYYVNGEEAASMAVPGYPCIQYSSSYKVTIGNISPGRSDCYYGGEVTNLNLYAETLSVEEVREMYKAGLCPPETDRHEDSRVVSWGEILNRTRSGSVTEFIPTICEVTKLKEENAAQSRTIASLRGQVTTLKDTNEDLSHQVTTQDQKIKDLSNQVTKQNQTIKDLGEHVTTQNHTIKQLRDQATDLQDTNEELKGKVTTQKESIDDLRDHVTTLKDTNEDLIEEVTTLRKCQKKKCKSKQGGKEKEQPEILEK